MDAAVRGLLLRILERAAGGPEALADIEVTVIGGVATLEGDVPTVEIAESLRDAALNADGIVAIAGSLRARESGRLVSMALQDGTGP